jgi:hypothetical protein
LAVDGSDNLSWTWSDADPDHWDIQQYNYGFGGWVAYDTAAGPARSYAGVDAGKMYRIYGADAGDSQTTGYSNEVLAP